MDKVYDHTKVEEKLYKEWEEKGYFKPEINPDGEPYSIILPPPNANAPLHFGHAMYVIEDILIRYKRMKGFKTLWLPGADHAGFETQFVFEKKLAQEGKSRFDYDRETLNKMILEFVQGNRPVMEGQLRKLGFSLDWSRIKFTLDPDIVETVCKTFKKLYDDGLVYRAERLVNFCTFDGTSFSDLEVINEEASGTLYQIHYRIKDSTVLDGVHKQYIAVATTRPETMFGDVAIMVNPKDKRFEHLVGKTAIIPLTNKEIPIIADEYVEMSFGTGAVKVTPNHDFNDYEVAKRNNLPMGDQVINFNGKMIDTGVVDGLYVKPARKEVVEKLQQIDALGIVSNHPMVLRKCYKCKNVLEPLPMEQWFVDMSHFKEIGKRALGQIKIYPRNYQINLYKWMENVRDWNISRQVVWGIRIPVWYKVSGNESTIAVSFIDNNGNYHPTMPIRQALGEGFSFEEIEKGIQRLWVPKFQSSAYNPEIKISMEKPGGDLWIQETDTFDTWFSSGQWPYATLKTTNGMEFYPTSVMETGRDILFFWVARMIMLGVYMKEGLNPDDAKLSENIPFKHVVLHGLVNDPLGKKMSKSKGNVVNPLELVEQYGADAVRFALVYGTALGNDQVLSYPKLEAARRFTNKLWNIARFIIMKREGLPDVIARNEVTWQSLKEFATNETDKEWVEKVSNLISEVTKNMEEYQFNQVSEKLYEFVWHQFADIYIEDVKNRIDENSFIILNSLFIILVSLLHPMMPFVTDEIFKKLTGSEKSLMIENWPNMY